MNPSRPHVVIVGGGIAGLAAAFFLREAPCRVTVLEGSARLGGNPETLYAYASRGVGTSRGDPAGGTHVPAERERRPRTSPRPGGGTGIGGPLPREAT